MNRRFFRHFLPFEAPVLGQHAFHIMRGRVKAGLDDRSTPRLRITARPLSPAVVLEMKTRGGWDMWRGERGLNRICHSGANTKGSGCLQAIPSRRHKTTFDNTFLNSY